MIQPRKQINNIYGYVRVSSEQQVKDGSSLDEQKRSIEEFVANKYGGRKVDQFFTDAGISGMKLGRPCQPKVHISIVDLCAITRVDDVRPLPVGGDVLDADIWHTLQVALC